MSNWQDRREQSIRPLQYSACFRSAGILPAGFECGKQAQSRGDAGATKTNKTLRLKFLESEPVPSYSPCCYNAFMTLMEITYELQSRLEPEQLRALGSFANTYGLRRFRVDEQANRLSFEYDASRLKETEVEHILRQAKIPVLRRVEPVGTTSQI
jgi:hypothetical protein